MEAEKITFKVGDGATKLLWTDSNAYTVIEVSASGKRIKLQRDNTTLMNKVGSGAPDALQFSPGGFVGHTSGVQRWEYMADPDGHIIEASLRKDGKWREKGSSYTVIVKGRCEHYDFNF